ncbi:hypothetical protein M0R45_031412 [Rubus argutus]|uniref:Interferon-related developmental regulator N-terminal domain-containing protein n=1 Tax=Rubus argutus TaxID=59490 RepID=A0AAW1WGA6_RUBAR
MSMKMMRGNCNRSSSGPSNCARRTSSSSSNFKAARQKVAPPRNKDSLLALIQDIHRLDIHKLREKLEDTETPASLKREIKLEIETRQHDEDDVTSVIVEQAPQRPPAPVKASPYLIDRLYDKRGPERAKALATVITLLNNQELDHDDLKKSYVVTLLYRCLHGLKKGSTKEMQYSLQVIGLLSIIVDCQDKMSEIYREFLAVASTKCCLKKAGTNTAKMLECLGIVTFFGAINAEEAQAAMKVIWDFILNPKSESGSDDVINRKNQSPEILVAAIYAWLFLLTSMEGWRLNQSYWTGAISFFTDLLDNNDDKLVHGAACAALALIFETGSLDKFWNGANDSTLPYSQLRKTVRAMILKKLKGLNMSLHVVIQLEFLRSFLGDEFENYMAKEEKLQSFFEFDPYRNDNVGDELYVPTIEKIMVHIFMPEGRDPQILTAEERKKERVWRTSVRDKAQTLLRAKHRLLSEQLNCFD